MRLLDVNVLIALADSGHPFHRAATKWMEERASSGWVTCPITENALIRILSSPAYPRSPGSVDEVRRILMQLRYARGHVFWSDDVSFGDLSIFPSLITTNSKQLTDIYLLALAVKHTALFTTFDSKIPASLVVGGASVLEVIPV